MARQINNKRPLGKGLGALVDGGFDKKVQGVAIEIDIHDIQPNPYQPRTSFADDALETLSQSISQYGLVQPIVVRKVDEGYQIVAGERRWRACKLLSMDTITAIVKDYSTAETTEIALVENLQRQNLDPIEEAYAYERLMKMFKLTQEEISTKVGRSRSHIANMLRLLKLPLFLQNELSAGEITIGQVRPLLALPTEQKQKEALTIIYEKDLNSRQIEALVKQLLKESHGVRKTSSSDTAELRDLVDRLKTSLGASVQIKLNKGKHVKGKIEIQFASEEELMRLMSYIEGETEVTSDVDSNISTIKTKFVV